MLFNKPMESVNKATNQVAQVFRDALRHWMRRHLRTCIDNSYRPDLVIVVGNHSDYCIITSWHPKPSSRTKNNIFGVITNSSSVVL